MESLKRVAAVPVIVMGIGALACGGAQMDNQPGDDTWLEPDPYAEHAIGSVAVERDEDHVWVVNQGSQYDSNGVLVDRKAFLTAIDPGTGAAVDVIDVSEASDRRIIFPSANRAILLAQDGGSERLVLLDTDALAPIVETTKSVWYWGTRTSASGRWLVVADNESPDLPIHLIDTETLDHTVVPHGGDTIEAMWNETSDKLHTIDVTGLFGSSPVARIRRWSISSLNGFTSPEIDIELAGYDWDFGFSYTWIGISPDDRWAVYPLYHRATGENVLVVLDQTNGTTRTVPGKGPVGFTPDGSTIVSWKSGDPSRLLMINAETLATDEVEVPIAGDLSYFVTWDGNYVVCTQTFSGRLVIHDPVSNTVTEVDGPEVSLREFVTRPGHKELWLASNYHLYRLGLADAALQDMGVPFEVNRLNILPSQDRLAIAPPKEGKLWFYDMASQQVDGSVSLTPPLSSTSSVPRLGDLDIEPVAEKPIL